MNRDDSFIERIEGGGINNYRKNSEKLVKLVENEVGKFSKKQ